MCTSPLFRIKDLKYFDMPRWLKSQFPQILSYEAKETFLHSFKNYSLEDLHRIPCGQCIECRIQYSRTWADRCVLESREYPEDYNWFVTLTYDDDHLPGNVSLLDTATGEIKHVNTLVKRDLSDFMHNLRQILEREYNFVGVRFYAAGEYGDKNLRPHFHPLLFNCPLSDIRPSELFRHSEACRNSILFESEIINRAWGHKGLACVGRMTWHSAAYVARYVNKKLKGVSKKEFDARYLCFDADGKSVPWQHEFSLMSLKPGIAAAYCERHMDEIYTTDELIFNDGRSVVKRLPPKYFDKLYQRLHPHEFEDIKEARTLRSVQKLVELEQTDLSELEYLELRENAKRKAIEKLYRIL